MRRGRIITALTAAFAAALVALPTAALADGGTPMDICQDLQDGKLDGSYTVAQLQAFFTDPSVQGYCSPVVVVTPPPPVTTTTTTPAPPPPPPVTTTTPAPAPPAPTPAPPAPAPVTPVVITGVKGTTHTSTPVPAAAAPAKQASVKGAQHTVSSPKRASVAPLSTARKQGTLPFTGAQLALFLLVGLGLVATGLVLRATGRRRPEA